MGIQRVVVCNKCGEIIASNIKCTNGEAVEALRVLGYDAHMEIASPNYVTVYCRECLFKEKHGF